MKSIYRNTSQAVRYGGDNFLEPDGRPIYPGPIPGQEQVSTTETQQTFQLEQTGLWEPLGPVTENRWSYTLPTWSFEKGVSAGSVTIDAFYELPELLAMGGLPSSIYVYFSVTSGGAELDRTTDWSCEFDFGKLFETGTISSPTYYVTEYLACFAAKFTGRLRPVSIEPPRISVKVNSFFQGSSFDNNKRFLNMSLDGTAYELY